jgi:hypothetical protein
LILVLEPAEPAGAVFAASYLALLAAACVGPWLEPRHLPAFALAAVVVLVGAALEAGASAWRATAAALYVALFAATALAVGRTVYRPAVVAMALALLTTFFYWDGAVLFGAEDRRAAAALAFALNPAAAVSRTIGFDWMHAKALYSHSQTAESMWGVPLPGLPTMAWKTALVLVPFAALAWRRERRA